MKPLISIVTGTYNRISSLQRMVESIRASVKFKDLSVAYEIVLVDGGSDDGTQDWSRQQPNIRLIEHGELRGAVKAFNDGAYASEGDYVILGNDDIEFVGSTLWVAWLYMEEHPNCGMGCFYQDRNNKDWHVERMPIIKNGVQAHGFYGQVCIVQKWLGDKVGWWLKEEDYLSRNLRILHTYGGDNELSAKVYETGYSIQAIEGCKIHDHEIRDFLREKNNIGGTHGPEAVKGYHPDSWSWGRRWRQPGRTGTGPIVQEKPIMEREVKTKDRVLYLPIYERGWPVQKEQKRGLRNALENTTGIVVEYDYVGRHHEVGKDRMMDELRQYCFDFHPTLILSQIHNASEINHQDVLNLKRLLVSSLWVNWNGDFWPDNLLGENNIALSRAFDLQLLVNRQVIEQYKEQGIKVDYWQVGWEPDGVGQEVIANHDVTYLANGYSNYRLNLVKEIKSFNVNFGLYGQGWPNGWTEGQTLYDFKRTCGILRGCKITIGDSQWPDSGFVSNRLIQSLAAGGCVVAHQYFDQYEKLGLKDGQNCIIWRTMDELKEKVVYYLSHPNEQKKIADAGEKLALENHSFDVRVQELFQMLGEREIVEQKDTFDDWR